MSDTQAGESFTPSGALEEINRLRRALAEQKAHCEKVCFGYPVEGTRHWVSKEAFDALESRLREAEELARVVRWFDEFCYPHPKDWGHVIDSLLRFEKGAPKP